MTRGLFWERSKEQKQRLRELRKGCTPWNKGLKGVQVAWNKGKHHSSETIEKLRNKVFSEETRSKMRKSGKIKIFTDEHKKNISISLSGDKNPNWSGGKINHGLGYILIYKPEHPHNYHNYILEHRLIMEQYLERYLKPGEVVHHINEDRKDNRIENLMIFANAGKHTKYHTNLN